MKLRYSILTLFVILSFGFMLTACEGPPDKEIMDAEDAIRDAIAAGADVDSPKLLDKARTNLQEAKMYNEQGDYKEARKKAELAVIRGNKAAKNAKRLAKAHGDEVYETPATTEGTEEADKTEGSAE